MSLTERLKRFKYTAQGFHIAWREEPSFRFHIIWALLTLVCAYMLRVSATEFLIVIAMIGFVIVAELFNTALEELCDKFQPDHDLHIAKIKDLASAAVSTAAISAIVVGLIIFIPHILTFLSV